MPTAPASQTSPIYRILWVVTVFALAYYAWMMFDLLAHPFEPGANAIILPFLFRWLSGFCGTVTVLVALFILRHMPGNFIGLLLLLFGVGATTWSGRLDFGSELVNNIALVVQSIYFFFIALSTLPAILFHFPSGQVYPARFTGLAWLLIFNQSAAATLAIMGTPAFQNGEVTNLLYIPALFPLAGLFNTLMVLVAIPAAIVSLFLRFRAGGERERLQIKWLVWLSAVAIGFSLFRSIVFPDVRIADPDSLFPQLLKFLSFLYWQIFPALAIGIALLRYRLWDIDVIIRRTLLYTSLTGLFGLLYFGSVVVLRQALSFLTGESTLAIVLSTLLVAALFEPVRRRVQDLIDRRFYRQKYDAALALEEFSSATRREVALDRLTSNLVSVVEKTIQPEQVSVWLRDRKNQV